MYLQEDQEFDEMDHEHLNDDWEDDDWWDHDWETSEERIARLQEENERLKRAKQKLLDKKHKAIQSKWTQKKEIQTIDEKEKFQQWYKEIREKETFEQSNPWFDYDVVNAIAEKKGIAKEEAIQYLRSWGSYRIGQDSIPSPKKADDELKARLKSKLWLD